MIPYEPPAYHVKAYNCPYCNAYSKQHWFQVQGNKIPNYSNRGGFVYTRGELTYCEQCGKSTIWVNHKMIYPSYGAAPFPNPDLPDDIKEEYEEARSIVINSPRGAAALLRLAIQKLCVHLGEKGENINTDIKNLVNKGLSPDIQKALDVVRVIGNESVHPGEMNLKDNVGVAIALFELINLITEKMISDPKKIASLYEKLPEEKKKAIEERDGN